MYKKNKKNENKRRVVFKSTSANQAYIAFTLCWPYIAGQLHVTQKGNPWNCLHMTSSCWRNSAPEDDNVAIEDDVTDH